MGRDSPMAWLGLALSATMVAAGCGTSASNRNGGSDPCVALAGMTIPASAIGLATRGATVTSATKVAAAEAASGVEHCKVLGTIAPVGTSETVLDLFDGITTTEVPTTGIQFGVDLPLPAAWNGKTLHVGGGGFDGSVPALDSAALQDMGGHPGGLARGYVTLGSDSGHVAPYLPGGDPRAMWNGEVTRNFGRQAIKKTHDVAMAIVSAYYGRAPRLSYFAGGSQGGHEALIAAHFYPMDFDGVVVGYPAYDLEAMHPGSIDYGQTLYRARAGGGVNGFANACAAGEGWLSRPLMQAVSGAIQSACGATDGIVYDPGAPACASYRKRLYRRDAGNPLRCAGGVHASSFTAAYRAWAAETCLSDVQIETLARITSRYDFISNGTTPPAGLALQGGLRSYGRWPILDGMWFGEGATDASGKVLSTKDSGAQEDFGSTAAAFDAFQATFPTADQLGMLTRHGWSWTSTGGDNIASFDIASYVDRLQEVSSTVDTSEVDFSVFKGRGGKMIHYHGAADVSITPYNSIDLFLRMSGQFDAASGYLGKNAFWGTDDAASNATVSQNTDAAVSGGIVDGFYSFYLIPGYGHGHGYFNAQVDWLAALERWREQDIAPRNGLVATDSSATYAVGGVTYGHESLGTRPVCAFPHYPRYSGSGDARAATSYTCAKLTAYANVR